jgi:hypothetical protein
MWRRALIPKWQLNGLCAEREVTVSPGVAAGWLAFVRLPSEQFGPTVQLAAPLQGISRAAY